MAKCVECGVAVSAGENFCGACGTQQPVVAEDSASAASHQMGAEQEQETLENVEVDAPDKQTGDLSKAASAGAASSKDSPSPDQPITIEDPPVSSNSLGGSATGDFPQASPTKTHHKGTTGGHQPTIKQLDPGTVLTGRYEITRRIGGGGMGAVYLAKDRNLGDASRAVKEMVEAHLDPLQHEKAIGDFKRESLLLTALEHPSIPTIYDW
jgi:hypothetical protein